MKSEDSWSMWPLFYPFYLSQQPAIIILISKKQIVPYSATTFCLEAEFILLWYHSHSGICWSLLSCRLDRDPWVDTLVMLAALYMTLAVEAVIVVGIFHLWWCWYKGTGLCHDATLIDTFTSVYSWRMSVNSARGFLLDGWQVLSWCLILLK